MTGYAAPLNYGNELAKKLGVRGVIGSLIKPASKHQLGITHLISPSALDAPSATLVSEKALSISVHLVQPVWTGWGTWIDGMFHPVESWLAGGVAIYDLESDPIILRRSGFECINFHLSREILNVFTEQNGLPFVGELPFVQGKPDSILHHLALMVKPVISNPGQFCDLFWDHFVLMFCSRFIDKYAQLGPAAPVAKGGLAPWQKRRASEMLREHIRSGIRLHTLSSACGLSTSQFARSFRQTFATSVHRYFTGLRIERAKTLMAASKLSLAEIAIETGFPDQPGFCRTFAALTGTTPGKWRREHQFSVNSVIVSRMN